MTDTARPLISVVIPVYNGRGVIEECVESLCRSRFGPFEVIVVDDHSTDGALERLASFPIRVIPNSKDRGVSRARNLGISEARAGIVLLVDADILVPADLLGRVHQFFQANPGISFLQAAYDPDSYYKNVLSEYKNLIFSFRAHQDGKRCVPFIHGACVAGRSEIFKKYLFDTRLTRREDIDYGLRISREGLLIFNDPDISVRHKKKYGLISFFRYQLSTSRELIFQRISFRNKNIETELRRPEGRFYKKAWYLRPVVSGLVFLSLSGMMLGGCRCWGTMLLISAGAMLIFDAPFLRYLCAHAPRKVFLFAPLLYLLDGAAAGCGIVSGLWKACRPNKERAVP